MDWFYVSTCPSEYQTTANEDNSARDKVQCLCDENTKKAHGPGKKGRTLQGFWDVQPQEVHSTGSDFNTTPTIENDHNISLGDDGDGDQYHPQSKKHNCL